MAIVENEPRFTSDWFSHNIPHWEAAIAQAGRTIYRALELGVFEGRSVLWLLENTSVEEVTAVDWWDKEWLEVRGHFDTEANFDHNIAPYTNRVRKVKGTTFSFLKSTHELYDFIYIDGGHVGKNVITDAVLAHNQLNSGGLLIFDDYSQELDASRIDRPRGAINYFMELFADDYDVLHVGYQVILRKI